MKAASVLTTCMLLWAGAHMAWRKGNVLRTSQHAEHVHWSTQLRNIHGKAKT